MKDLSQLNLLLASVDTKVSGKNRTPGDIGNSLFRDLLQKATNSSSEKGWGLSLYQGTGSEGLGFLKNSDPGKNSLQDLERRIQLLGLPMGQLRLSEAAIPQLISYLQNQGRAT